MQNLSENSHLYEVIVLCVHAFNTHLVGMPCASWAGTRATPSYSLCIDYYQFYSFGWQRRRLHGDSCCPSTHRTPPYMEFATPPWRHDGRSGGQSTRNLLLMSNESSLSLQPHFSYERPSSPPPCWKLL